MTVRANLGYSLPRDPARLPSRSAGSLTLIRGAHEACRQVDRNQQNHRGSVPRDGLSGCSRCTVGADVPDIPCAIAGFNVPVEIKDGSGGFTPDQKKWHAEWGAPVHVVRDAPTWRWWCSTTRKAKR